MKRTVLCFFSLILILLAFFTMITPKVEAEMTTLAVTKRTEPRMNTSISDMSIQWEHGNNVIFTLAEGSGWETGLRITEMPHHYYSRYNGVATIGPGAEYLYIYSASRPPVTGGMVKGIKARYGKDTYLLWHPETIEGLGTLPSSMTLLSKTENAALLGCRNGAFPYFEHNMWYTFRGSVGDDVRVYSLHDAENFCLALPWITAVFAALLCCLILWGGTCALTRKENCKKWVWLGNIGLIGGLLCVIPVLLEQFDLPASLLPPEFILDISHYVGEFQRMTSAMADMGNDTLKTWLTQATTSSLLVALISILLTTGILLAEHLLSRRKEKC